MGLFQFNQNDRSDTPRNPDAYFGFRLLAAGYLLYLTWDVIKMYIEGGADKPSVGLLIFSVLFLGGGAIFIAISSFKLWRNQKKAAAQEAALEVQPEEVTEDPDTPADTTEEA